jgi:hypothetical protein
MGGGKLETSKRFALSLSCLRFALFLFSASFQEDSFIVWLRFLKERHFCLCLRVCFIFGIPMIGISSAMI